jgi:hypothetical protein
MTLRRSRLHYKQVNGELHAPATIVRTKRPQYFWKWQGLEEPKCLMQILETRKFLGPVESLCVGRPACKLVLCRLRHGGSNVFKA